MILVDAVGWAGALALLLAHALLAARRTSAGSRTYVVLNLAGSAGLALNGAVHAAWPSTALNLLWLAVGLTALRRRPVGAPTGVPPHRAPGL